MNSTRTVTLAAFIGLVGATSAVCQNQPPTDAQTRLAHADSLFLQRGFAAAADEYRAIVTRDSNNDAAWYRLGLSLERLGKKDEALAALSRAAKWPSQQLGAELAITRVLTQAGDNTAALDHLARAAKLGIDPAMLDQMPALASIRALPQYAAIRKTAEAVRFPCRDVHTFDFWAGDFDSAPWSAPSGRSGGQLHNTREYAGCVLMERWMPAAGGSPPGISVSFYDTVRKAWRFLWNDDGNGSIEFEGDYRDGAMRFEGSYNEPDGTKVLARNVLQNVAPDTIRHTFSTSRDGGKTWTRQADDRFVRRHP